MLQSSNTLYSFFQPLWVEKYIGWSLQGSSLLFFTVTRHFIKCSLASGSRVILDLSYKHVAEVFRWPFSPSITPTNITLCNYSGCQSVCSTIFHFLPLMMSNNNERFSPTVSSTSWITFTLIRPAYFLRASPAPRP